MSPAREPFSSVTLYCTAGFWLHGDWERAAWRLLSFLSVRDGNTHGLWGWLLEILWRGSVAGSDSAGQRSHRPLAAYQEDRTQDGCGGTYQAFHLQRKERLF